MWWLRRMTTVTTGCAASRSRAVAIARFTSQGPGRRRPSQVSAEPESRSVSGSPSRAMRPAAISSR